MATRGYQSYRGRNHGKLALVIVLVLILLAAVGYLVAQEYMVYDDEGHRHLELPFLKKGQTEQSQQPEDTTPDDVDLIIDEPERPMLKEFHARQLPDTVLTEDPSAVLAEHPEAVVIPVKLRDGTVTYDTQTAARDTVTTGGPETLTSLKTLLSGDTWTVARIACFADMDFANAQPDQAGLLRTGDGWLWYDDDAACWLDPGKAAAREYLVQLCKECAELGFDEILLDYCTYPIHGRLDRIDYGSVTNLTDTLSVFVEGVREALPKTTALSVLVRDQVTADANDGGVTLALLTEHFDRIYVDADTVDAAALQGLLPADFDPVTRLVQVAAEAASSGSYVTR